VKKFLVITLFLSLIYLPSAYAKTGKGEIKLDKNTMEFLLMYFYGAGNSKYSGADKQRNEPITFAVSPDGRYSSYRYCPFQHKGFCETTQSAIKTIKTCEKMAGTKCFTFARKNKIVWKNGGPKVKIKNKDLKSPYKVAKMIQEAGFYDGDISKLAGINVNTGQVDDDIQISGEKKTGSLTTTEDSSNDVVKELEALSELFEAGAITKEEFEKAKKKLLTN
jgi:hypothetical protein